MPILEPFENLSKHYMPGWGKVGAWGGTSGGRGFGGRVVCGRLSRAYISGLGIHAVSAGHNRALLFLGSGPRRPGRLTNSDGRESIA